MASASSYCIVGLITLVYVLGCTSSTVLLTPPAIDVQISYLSSTMCYNRSELLSYNDGTGKVSQDVCHLASMLRNQHIEVVTEQDLA